MARRPRPPSKPARQPNRRKAIAATATAALTALSAHGEIANPSVVSTGLKLRANWQYSVSEILQDARAVMELYEGLNAIFAPLKSDLARGDNRASERANVFAAAEQDKKTAAITAEVLQGQLESSDPQPKIVAQNAHVFRTLVNGAKLVTAAVGLGFFQGVGKAAGGQYESQLLELAVELADRLHHLASSIFALLIPPLS